jgi:cellulose 1,4-beta-cellobiosidase
LTWTAATGSPTSYNIKRSTTSGSGYTTIGTTTAPTVTFTDSVLGGPTYYYVVTAVNGGGESGNSSEVSASPTLAAPAAPAGLAATAGNAQVLLSWTASSFATGYDVKRATASAGPYAPIGTTTAPTVTYTDSGLNNGTTYYYVVSATGAGGGSSDTSPVSATPIGPKPLVVTIVRGQGVRWFASNGIPYQVQWSSALLGTNTVWNNLGGPISGNGATNTVFDPVGPPHNFFQVLSIQ